MKDYKGYQADVRYSAEDGCLVGRVIGTKDVILFDALAVDEIEASFHSAVDEYLEDCASQDVKPNKPYSGKFLIRIAPDMHRRLAMQAEASDKSLNALIKQRLEA